MILPYNIYTERSKCAAVPLTLRVTGIKLHYIRLLAGLELVLSATAPAKNPTEHRAHSLITQTSCILFSVLISVCSFIHASSLR